MRQRKLAQRLGEHQSFVSKYETGERRLDSIEFRTICETIGIFMEEFVRRWEEALAERCNKDSDSKDHQATQPRVTQTARPPSWPKLILEQMVYQLPEGWKAYIGG